MPLRTCYVSFMFPDSFPATRGLLLLRREWGADIFLLQAEDHFCSLLRVSPIPTGKAGEEKGNLFCYSGNRRVSKILKVLLFR